MPEEEVRPPTVALRFDADGTPFWSGRPLAREDLLPALECFDEIIGHHLMAWWEKLQNPLIRGPLPETGVLASMAGLHPLRRVLDFFESGLEAESWFADRLDTIPDPPGPLARSEIRYRFSPDTIAGEIERRNEAKRLAALQAAWDAREREIAEYQAQISSFRERLEKGKRFPKWLGERRLLEGARDRLEEWERKLSEAETVAGWDFLPPGPDLAYSVPWLRKLLGSVDPKATYDFTRIRAIQHLNPRAVRRGRVGRISGYLAFIFGGGKVALESPKIGNALYLFHSEWQILSQRPKSELRERMASGDLRMERYCHGNAISIVDWLKDRLHSGTEG